MDILYAIRRGIYPGRTLSIFRIHPTNRPDAIVRKVDGGRKNRPKMAYFSRFSEYLAYFPIWYQHEILNEGRGDCGTDY